MHLIALEILFSIIEKYPKLISSDEEKLSNLITGIFKYGMEFDDKKKINYYINKK